MTALADGRVGRGAAIQSRPPAMACSSRALTLHLTSNQSLVKPYLQRRFRVPHEHDEGDANCDRHESEYIEGRGITEPDDQETRDDRPGCLAKVPDGPEYTHGSAEAPCRCKIGDQRVGHWRHRGNAEAK